MYQNTQKRKMKLESIDVEFIKITDVAVLAAYKSIYGKTPDRFGEARFTIVVSDVPTEYINSIRRALIDESEGYALDVNKEHEIMEYNRKHTTEEIMLMPFLDERISQIPLRKVIPKDVIDNLKYKLEVENRSSREMYVFAGSLVPYGIANPPILFSPFHLIASIQPGKRLLIKQIDILRGISNAQFHVCRQVSIKPLDIKEYPREQTHIRRDDGTDAVHGYESGFMESCTTANPRKYRLTAYVPATDEKFCNSDIKIILKRACESIINRIRKVTFVVSERNSTGIESRHGILYTSSKLQSGMNRAMIKYNNITETVGELIVYAFQTLFPDVSICTYEYSSDTVTITIEYKNNITHSLSKALEMLERDFTNFQSQI